MAKTTFWSHVDLVFYLAGISPSKHQDVSEKVWQYVKHFRQNDVLPSVGWDWMFFGRLQNLHRWRNQSFYQLQDCLGSQVDFLGPNDYFYCYLLKFISWSASITSSTSFTIWVLQLFYSQDICACSKSGRIWLALFPWTQTPAYHQ